MTDIVKLNGVTVATSYSVIEGKKVVFWHFRDGRWVSVPKVLFDQMYAVGGQLECVKRKKNNKWRKLKRKKIGVVRIEPKKTKKNNKGRKNRRTKKSPYCPFSKRKATLHFDRRTGRKDQEIDISEQPAAQVVN